MIERKKLFPYLTAVLGFAFAWFLKPSHNESAKVSLPDVSAANALNLSRKFPSSSDKQHVTQHSGLSNDASLADDSVDLPEELVRMREQMAEQLSQGLSIRDHGFIRRMTELLGLREEQQLGMLRLLERKRKVFHIFPTNSKMPQNLLERAEKAETEYHQALGQILDQHQVSKYNDYKKQQARNRAIASAKNSYADVLKHIDLNENQQSAVENAIRNVSVVNQPTMDKTQALYEAYDTMGYGTAAGTMATSSGANAAIAQASDKVQMLQEVVATRKRESTAQLEALRPILTTAQWEQYKSVIDAKDRSFYMSIQPFMSSAPVDPKTLDPNAEN